MNASCWCRPTIGALVAVGMLAGCGGAGTTAAVPPAVTQSVARHDTSSSSDLLYVSDHGGQDIVMLTYPQGTRVGSFVPPDLAWNICSDSAGNVWVPDEYAIYEYAHGATNIEQTLGATGLLLSACAVDPTTGNLAAIGDGHYGTPTLAIWSGAQGNPTTYTLPFHGWAESYDGSGNLFIDGDGTTQGFSFAELPKGSSTFTAVTLDQPAERPGSVQWDGKFIAVSTVNPNEPKGHHHVVYRVRVSGSSGHVVQTVVLRNENSVLGSWIDGSMIVAVHGKTQGDLADVSFWKYPQGGRPLQTIKGFAEAWGITVSVAPTQSRGHN